MKLLDVVTSPWAIQPEKLIEIQAIYATHLRGEKIDIGAVEKRIGRPLANEPQGYEVRDGVAILPVQGVIAKRMNLFSQISGGVSTELVARDLKAALADPAVEAIVLAIDSPGGTVDGTQALADLVAGARGTKPIVTWSDGCMCSAAYWIGAAADAVYIDSGTVQVGSIGVVASHVDVSQREAQMGVKTTEIVAGKYKRIASQYGPLTEEGRASMQEQVDYLYSLFVGAVAKSRGVSEEKVLQDMADGRVFIGAQAVAAGLVDGVSTLDGLIASLRNRAAVGASQRAVQQPQGEIMDRESILANAPELAEAFRAEGAAAERARILAVEAQALPGHDTLIAQLKADGKTTGPEAAAAVLAAERSKLAGMAQLLAADAPAPVAHDTAPAAAPLAVEDGRSVEERCKAKWEADAGLRAEFGTLGAFVAYTKNHEAGRARVLGK